MEWIVVFGVLLILALGVWFWIARRERRTIQQAQDRKREASRQKRSAAQKDAAARKKQGGVPVEVDKSQPLNGGLSDLVAEGSMQDFARQQSQARGELS